MKLFRTESNNHKCNAQLNLESLTHYVDDDTLRFHKSRVISSHVVGKGLLFAIVESYATFESNRLFRPVIFDINGNTISRSSLEDGFKTSKQATDSMWEKLNKINAIESAHAAVKNHLEYEQRQAGYITDEINALTKKGQ